MTTRIDDAVRVANTAALTALTAATVPSRVDKGIYFIDDCGVTPVQGRWAQYWASSSAAVGINVLMPVDSVGRWHLGKASDPLPDGLLNAAAHVALEPDDCHPPKAVTFAGDPSLYTPSVVGVLVIRSDVDPWRLYATTGLAAGNLQLVGSVSSGGGGGGTTTGSAEPTDNPPNALGEFYVQIQGSDSSFSVRVWLGIDTSGSNGDNGWVYNSSFY